MSRRTPTHGTTRPKPNRSNVPFPRLHADTIWKFRAMIEFRDRVAREAGLDLLVHINEEGRSRVAESLAARQRRRMPRLGPVLGGIAIAALASMLTRDLRLALILGAANIVLLAAIGSPMRERG